VRQLPPECPSAQIEADLIDVAATARRLSLAAAIPDSGRSLIVG
jgi:hypothetical protein